MQISQAGGIQKEGKTEEEMQYAGGRYVKRVPFSFGGM